VEKKPTDNQQSGQTLIKPHKVSPVLLIFASLMTLPSPSVYLYVHIHIALVDNKLNGEGEEGNYGCRDCMEIFLKTAEILRDRDRFG